ncbi:MAG: TonB-dependent siderophore receptor [Paracoccus sp. (in: a-proteobacteria)]|nr:TonB-dependent siderophore receptor [Paracoccus sp. (in: a-proteobacteria)]
MIALSVGMATAQDADGPTVLDEIVLTATTDTSVQVDGYVATYAQAATKSDTPIAQTPQSVSVVTNQQIEDQGATTLGQALNYSAGVLGQPYGADPRFDSPTLRGFEARDAQYVNGLRQLRYMGAPAYEIYGMQQVEVLRGPSSSLYGAGSPAGIINQVQKRAQSYDFAEIGAGIDSNSGGQAFFDVNRVANDTLSWRLTGIARDSKPQIEELDNKRGYLAAAARWQATDTTTIDFMASYLKDSPLSPTGVPYALTQIADGKSLRDFYTGEEGWDDSDRRMFNFGIEISHELENGWRLDQGFRYENFDWNYRGMYVTGLSGTEITRGANRQSEDASGINLDTRLSGVVDTGQVTHNLLFGVDIRKYDSRTTTEFFTAPSLDWVNPVRGNLPTGAAWYVANSDITLKQVGIYAQDQVEVGNWRAALALRHDRAEVTGWSERAGNRVTVDQSDNKTTGRAGLSYVFDNGVMPYVSYSTSFEPVDAISYAGVQVEGSAPGPSTAKQWELGVKYEPTAFNGLITAAIYDLRQENIIENLGGGTYRNIGEVKSRGFELEATAEIAEGWDLRGSYSFNKTEQMTGTNAGNEMANAPRHLANLWLDRDFGNGWRVGGGIRYIGSRFGDSANSYDMGAVTLADLGATYTYDNIEASLNVSNLTDKVYLANCGSFGCYYGEGRVISAQLTRKW